MKKTININLAGYPFTVDEDAYEMLSQYLDTLRHAFSSNDYDDELIEDFETRIAELLLERCPAPTIVTATDVAAIISRLGKPEEMMESERIIIEEPDGVVGETVTAQTPPPFNNAENLNNPADQKPRHRLYRDIDNKLLGGVCSGIAAYMGWDVVWVRLIFVALMFASASSVVVAYFILWIVVPAAVTPLQKMELRGEAPTLQNIGERVVSMTSTAKQSGASRVIGAIGKVLLIFIAAIAIPVLGAVCLALVVCLGLIATGASALWTAILDAIGFSLPITPEPTLYALTALSILIAIAIPLVLLITAAFRSGDKPAWPTRGWRIVLVVVWILSIIGSGICCSISYKNITKNFPVPGHAENLIEKAEEIQTICDSISAEADSIGQNAEIQLEAKTKAKAKKIALQKTGELMDSISSMIKTEK